MKTWIALQLVLTTIVLSTHAADFEIKNDGEFKKIIPPGAKLQKLAGDFKFTEGPVWIPEVGRASRLSNPRATDNLGRRDARPTSGCLIFSDIPANHLIKWDSENGATIFREDSHNSNGNTIDRKNRLITAEHGGRRVSLTEKNGEIKTITSEYDGKKLNSPNDVVVKSDGTIWFTDPDYGVGKKEKEQPGNFVFRFDPKTKKLTVVAKDFDKPNGLCFSPDEKKLYIADSGKPHDIRVFDVQKNGTLTNGKVFCVIDQGVPDGIRCDKQGRIWSSAGDGIQIFAPDGSLIGKILVPEPPANLCFGGKDGKTLFITARSSLYALETSQKN